MSSVWVLIYTEGIFSEERNTEVRGIFKDIETLKAYPLPQFFETEEEWREFGTVQKRYNLEGRVAGYGISQLQAYLMEVK